MITNNGGFKRKCKSSKAPKIYRFLAAVILCSCPRSIKSRERSERCDERAHGERSEPRSEREYMIQQGY